MKSPSSQTTYRPRPWFPTAGDATGRDVDEDVWVLDSRISAQVDGRLLEPARSTAVRRLAGRHGSGPLGPEPRESECQRWNNSTTNSSVVVIPALELCSVSLRFKAEAL